MTYVLIFYQVSAVLAALCLLPYLDDFFGGVRAIPSRHPSLDQIMVFILVMIFILMPVLNSLLVLHCVDCYFRYPNAR